MTLVSSPSDVHEEAYNISHAAARNTVQREFGLLKLLFIYLEKKIRTKLETTQAIIVASFVLHNIAVQLRLVIPEKEEGEVQGNPANHALQRQTEGSVRPS